MANGILNHLTTGVEYSIWTWNSIAEQVGNLSSWGVTTTLNLIRPPQPISDAKIKTISDLATRAKEFKSSIPFFHPSEFLRISLNTTGEKIDAFINRKSSSKSQTEGLCEAIVDAARIAKFPTYEEKARASSFTTAVKKIITPKSTNLTWSECYGFATQMAVQFGLTSILRTGFLFYTLSWIPTNSYFVLATSGLAGIWGYSYVVLPLARQELKEVKNPHIRNKLQPLKKEVIDAIMTQAMNDFSLKNQQGFANALYSENLTTFQEKLKAIGQVQVEVEVSAGVEESRNEVPPSPAKNTLQTTSAQLKKQTDGFAANNVKKSKLLDDVPPLVSETPKKSKLEIIAPKYEGLTTKKLENWFLMIESSINHYELSPEEANVVLNEQLEIVNKYLASAVVKRQKDLQVKLGRISAAIENQMTENTEKIEDAKLQPKRALVDSFNAVAPPKKEPKESQLSWVLRCCGFRKKAEEPSGDESPIVQPKPSGVERDPPSSIKRRTVNQSVDESNLFENISISPPRTTKFNQSQAPFDTPIHVQKQNEL